MVWWDKLDHNLNLVLHISLMTFLGCGLSGPLSRCPDVKYSHPSQKPANVVFTRKGSFPITDHVCYWYKSINYQMIKMRVTIIDKIQALSCILLVYFSWVFTLFIEFAITYILKNKTSYTSKVDKFCFHA
jgi:predicted small lipoprotein YifL